MSWGELFRVVAWGVWFLCLLLYIGYLAVVIITIDSAAACPFAPGISVYGDSSWGWLPPGRVCTYEPNLLGPDQPSPGWTERPGPLAWFLPGVVVAVPVALRVWKWRARRA
ncbi:hypothetical protein [Embleya sp. NBC_00896]|uniref:hypothetical protein n=1 Tax=Embleya sp. NBC_00896 TaxID=2975961 RepID=UPI002F917BB2|nr:hypothetical protein OG928_39555 [Embleya sp. NBC_00896]